MSLFLCSWQPIMKFINDQYEKYLQEEININRKKRIPDTRVHCCIYFIPATGHSYVPPYPTALIQTHGASFICLWSWAAQPSGSSSGSPRISWGIEIEDSVKLFFLGL